MNELNYNTNEQEQLCVECYNQLNNNQNSAFNTIIAAITDNSQYTHFFL